MPIVLVRSKPISSLSAIELVAAIRKVGSNALNCAPSNVWVVYEPFPEATLLGDGRTEFLSIVTVKAQAGRSPEARTAFVSAIANTVGEALEIPPGEVWIQYQEMRPEDVWFEGRWAKSTS
jgi:phenylpyruvate tautomerase PptA (4-oxalocrotonate tautomerase family)